MNGAPVPPNLNPDPPYWFLFVLFLVAIIVVFSWLIFREIRRQRKAKAFEEMIAETKKGKADIERQTLINEAPGGRKKWQQ